MFTSYSIPFVRQQFPILAYRCSWQQCCCFVDNIGYIFKEVNTLQSLAQLSTDRYQSGKKNVAFLMHSTGHHPAGSEIDASIIYADYYYLEALMRAKALK